MNILEPAESRLVSINIRRRGRLPIDKRTAISRWIAECNSAEQGGAGCYIFKYPGRPRLNSLMRTQLIGNTHLVFFDAQDAVVFRLQFDL